MPRPAAPQRADPRKDPRYQRVVAKLDDASKKLKKHPPAAKKANEPAKAAKPPANEKAAGARAKQVDKLDQAETPKPQPKGFLETLKAEIEKAMPKTLDDTAKFMKGGSAEQMKGSLKGNVAEEKDASTGDMKKTSQAQPSESGVVVKPVTPIAPEPAPPSPLVDGAEAMPAPKSDADVSLQESKSDVQGEMDKNKLTDARLKKANDPRFSAGIETKNAVVKQADAGPAQYRAKEAGVLGQAAAKAMDVAKKGAVMMLGVKGGSKAKVQSRQEQQKAKEELELKTFSDFVVATFQRAKEAVDKRLEALDKKVNEMFDKGIEANLADMKTYVEDALLTYKLKRYLLYPWGAALWIKDQFLDLPDEVNKFYETGRARFTTKMNALAVDVANLVESQLAAAKKEVKDAQKLIADRTATLSPGVKARGAQLQAEFNGKFAELESGIEDKKQQLAEGLAQKYKEAFTKADESLKAIQDENKGLVTKAKEKIGEIIKALKEFKDRLMAIMKKAANAVEIILDDPIQFLKHLLNALKQGFTQFVDNIWTHLKAGFIAWLFGSLSKLGVELPKDLSLGSILKLVLGVLGITYAKMRQKAVKLLGPTAVTVIEKVAEYILALINGGPAALWEKVKEDLSNLKEMVIDAIQDWLITTIVKKAVTKIVSLFNPVGAIIQAILLIVDVVKFVIEKASQLLEFVEAVVNSLYDIATGAIGTAANWIEKALGRMVPLLIGFLADLLGLGGITEKIKEFIKKVQDRVDKAIDKAIAKIVEVVKKVVGVVKAGAKALLEWWKREKKFTVDGESHKIFFGGSAKNAKLRVASDEESLEAFLKKAELKKTDKKSKGYIADIRLWQTEIEYYREQRKPPKPDAPDPVNDGEINGRFDLIAGVLPQLFFSDEWGSEGNPILLDYPKKSPSLYRTLYLGPLVKGRIKQEVLKDRMTTYKPKGPTKAKYKLENAITSTPTALEEWLDHGGKIQEYKPFEPKDWPDGKAHGGSKQLGVGPQFLAQVGTNFKYEPETTPGGWKLNEELKEFGYYGKKRGGEYTDGDHVLEAQLIGRDRSNVIPNMWPLDKKENRHGQNLNEKSSLEINLRPDLSFKGIAAAAKSKDKKKAKGLRIMIKSTREI